MHNGDLEKGNSMKVLQVMHFLLITMIASLAHAHDGKSIRIATEGAFPPWNAIDTTGKPIGFDIDVGTALCQRAKLQCEFVTQVWDGIIPALNVGKYDEIGRAHV